MKNWRVSGSNWPSKPNGNATSIFELICVDASSRPPPRRRAHFAQPLFAANRVLPPELAPAATGYDIAPRSDSHTEVVMARCETCGNDYDKAFQVILNGSTHTYDSFECAIHALAPTCVNCGIRIVGHGLEKDGTFFCCEHCAEVIGVTGLRDRISAAA
jgi:hypothetical protein